jgi:magnesium-transporting ATPase (P-type)
MIFISLLLGTESYLGPRNTIDVSTVVQDLFSFVILYNYIIPISLYVTIGECHVIIFELEVHENEQYYARMVNL